MEKQSKIFVAGHTGLVGSAIHRALTQRGYEQVVAREHRDLDLIRQADTERFFRDEEPEYVFVAAARVGGILANNTYPAEFIYTNLMIESNIIHSAHRCGVKKLLFLGSSCIYPKHAPQPLKEEYLLSGKLEPTNEAYALAKIAGIGLCKFYRRQYGAHFVSAMPTNLYGINDNFDLESSHVLPAMIRRFHEAKVRNEKEVVIWGTGSPRREFLYVDDLADALIFLMKQYDEEEHINIGTGEDIEISQLARIIKNIVGFQGDIRYDLSKPDGTPRKLLDISKLHRLGWTHTTSLEEGISRVYSWYLEQMPQST